MRSPNPIPHRIHVMVLCALLAMVVAACDGSSGYRSPTFPHLPTNPPPANLAGAWTGTVTVTFEDDEGSCTESVTATFAQDGSAVSGTLTDSSGCHSSNQFRFEGTLEGDSLYGNIILPDFSWPATGRVSANQLTISAFNVLWQLRR